MNTRQVSYSQANKMKSESNPCYMQRDVEADGHASFGVSQGCLSQLASSEISLLSPSATALSALQLVS